MGALAACSRGVRVRAARVLYSWGGTTHPPGTTALRGLPAGEQIHYRVTLADPGDPRRTGEPVVGTFRTAPARRRDGVRFV
ncbi:hypothetical protein ACWDX6_25625 [Streptomyces sp. NPDC003027]